MYRDLTYQDPFSTLGIKDLLALGRLSGRRSLQAKWEFLALLPEISEREAYRLEGFNSLSEYAAIKGGIGRDEVGLVLSLHRRIGQFWVLWRLFAMGAVGVSKSQRIARWVTAENAAWWAEQVVKCTRAQLDALIEAMRSQESAAESGPVEMGPKPAPHHGESPTGMRPPEVEQSRGAARSSLPLEGCAGSERRDERRDEIRELPASQASPGAAARIAAGQGSITPENASEPAREATATSTPEQSGCRRHLVQFWPPTFPRLIRRVSRRLQP
jgi:hypothetical protein